MSPLSDNISGSGYASIDLGNTILNKEPSPAQQEAFDYFKEKETEINKKITNLRIRLFCVKLEISNFSNEESARSKLDNRFILLQNKLEKQLQQVEEELENEQDKHEKLQRKLELIDHNQQLFEKLNEVETST